MEIAIVIANDNNTCQYKKSHIPWKRYIIGNTFIHADHQRRR